MDTLKKNYLIWIVVAAIVLGSCFFVYKKIYGLQLCFRNNTVTFC